MIYLDRDTMIFNDIPYLSRISFNNSYILSFLCLTTYSTDIFSISIKKYINYGVLLFNIKEIRKSNLDLDLLAFVMNNNDKANFLEQDTLNYI